VAVTSVADLCDGVVTLIAYLEGEIEALRAGDLGAVEACRAPLVSIQTAVHLRRSRQVGPVRQTQLEDLESMLSDARQALTSLAGIDLSGGHPPELNDPPAGPRSA
jgi:hypothetical protein